MNDPPPYQALADAVLTLHVGIVVFVIGGLVLIVVGNLRSWRWVNGIAFRLAHLAATGVACPLTTLEMWLRTKARAATYDGSFLEHWLGRMLYYDAPAWTFTLAYSLFALAVAAAWWRYPPKLGRR
jgi:hypothetical protein